MDLLAFLKGATGFLQKHGRDGLDAFVVLTLMATFPTLVKGGIDQYLAAGVVVAALGLYLWHRNRSDYHKERMAQIEVDQIEKQRGEKARSQARKRLQRSGRGVGAQAKGGSDGTGT